MGQFDKDALPQGASLRQLWPHERDAFLSHLLRLDDKARHARFGFGVADEFLENYAETAFSLDSVIHGCFLDGELRATGELRALLEDGAQAAEAAFTVEPPWQDSGIGTELMRLTIRSARNQDIHTLYMICLASNKRMQRIAKKHNADLTVIEGSVEGRIDPPGPTPASVTAEWMDNTQGFVTAIFSWPVR